MPRPGKNSLKCKDSVQKQNSRVLKDTLVMLKAQRTSVIPEQGAQETEIVQHSKVETTPPKRRGLTQSDQKL